jgi:hypothetical protein
MFVVHVTILCVIAAGVVCHMHAGWLKYTEGPAAPEVGGTISKERTRRVFQQCFGKAACCCVHTL